LIVFCFVNWIVIDEWNFYRKKILASKETAIGLVFCTATVWSMDTVAKKIDSGESVSGFDIEGFGIKY